MGPSPTNPAPGPPGAPSDPPRMRIGEGRISGALSVFLGILGLGGVLCFHFPEVLTTPEFRVHYGVEVLRRALLGCLVGSVAFALTSFVLGARRAPGVLGIGLSVLAVLLGGNTVELGEFEQGPVVLSLDWLLLDSLMLSALFVPIELFLPQRREQTKFHREWRLDLTYFAISHLAVQAIAVAVRLPAETLFGGWGLEGLHSAVAGLPFLVALPLAVLTADLFQYGIHRAFHRFEGLWRFHAVHHSIRTMDWVAGSRLHLVDILVTRAVSYVPLYVLGFAPPVFYAYVAIVALQAVGAHANTRVPFGFLEHLIVTPRYHQWHHSTDPRHHDRNFAIHFPWVDRLFGTHHLPREEWPGEMGLGEERLPSGFLAQFVHPFRRSRER